MSTLGEKIGSSEELVEEVPGLLRCKDVLIAEKGTTAGEQLILRSWFEYLLLGGHAATSS